MIKTFKRCYQTLLTDEHITDIIEIETDGLVSDWYPKLYSNCHAFIIKHDYRTNDYITKLVVWDNDDDVYVYKNHDTKHLMTKGAYIKYVRNSDNPNGVWYGQYPYNAWRCNGLFVKDISQICEWLRKNPEYHKPVYHDGLGDLLSATLFPDHVINVDQDVNATIIPQKNQAMKAIDDAIVAFEVLNQLNLKAIYGQVPEQYIQATQHIVNRLANARMWIENSTIKPNQFVD